MDTLLSKIFDFNFYYLFSTTLLIYGILKYLIKKPNKLIKIGVSLVVGLGLGFLFYKLDSTNTQQLIYTFTVAMVLYNWIIKEVLRAFNDHYDNNKGLV